jgi:para-aminobenzoate synthetase/4-amino-4-deoxychorismate lyase
VRAILRDAASGVWRLFERPRELVVAREIAEVIPALERIEAACANGAYAAGFIAYEAAPAFDAALHTKAGDVFPLVWFGLYDAVHELPRETIEAEQPDEAEAVLGEAWTASIGSSDYARAFDRLQELIRAGHTYQVNFTYRFRSHITSSPWALFRHLVSAQEPEYAAYLHAGEWIVCSASPELFFERNGSAILSRPMKGTAARGLWFEQDLAQATRLEQSEKERAENVMIVDMVRNDLGRIAAPGSVKVSRLFETERYPTVWQMTSDVSASTDASLVAILAALFPPASITGTPKASTMDIIAELECSPRRIYTGTIGFIEPGGRAQFNVAIRTALLNRKTGDAEFGAGGGIVSDSSANQEMAEAELKAKVLGTRRPAFDLLETLAWKPKDGYLLLDLHLRRLMQSAEYFRFDVDLRTVGERLRQLAAGFSDESHRVRLVVSKHGGVELTATRLTPEAATFADVGLAAEPIDASDPFLYHKTTNRAVYERAVASRPGLTDVLLYNARREVTESTLGNLIFDLDGTLFTPPVACGLLAGTGRAQLLAHGTVRERALPLDEIPRARRLYLVNSVRGMQPVSITDSFEDRDLCKPSSDTT